MKIKLLLTILVLLSLTALKSQTYITSSDSTLCSGNSATLTAHHDFLHNWCTWSTGTQSSTVSIVVSPTLTTVYTATCVDASANPTYASFTQTVAVCTGIKKELANAIIGIFPNPSSDRITVSGLEKNTTIEIYNALGAVSYRTCLLYTSDAADD